MVITARKIWMETTGITVRTMALREPPAGSLKKIERKADAQRNGDAVFGTGNTADLERG